MAKLSKAQVEHVAKLARLELSEKEKEKFSEQLSEILDYVEQLNKVDTEGVEPIAQITGMENVMAEDKVAYCDISRDKLLTNAPAQEKGFLKVKAVLEEL